jgi:hypothetical protein
MRQIQNTTDGPNIIAGKGAEFFNQFSSFFAYGRDNEFGAAVVAHPQSILSNTRLFAPRSPNWARCKAIRY